MAIAPPPVHEALETPPPPPRLPTPALISSNNHRRIALALFATIAVIVAAVVVLNKLSTTPLRIGSTGPAPNHPSPSITAQAFVPPVQTSADSAETVLDNVGRWYRQAYATGDPKYLTHVWGSDGGLQTETQELLKLASYNEYYQPDQIHISLVRIVSASSGAYVMEIKQQFIYRPEYLIRQTFEWMTDVGEWRLTANIPISHTP